MQKILILGGGFAGYHVAKGLEKQLKDGDAYTCACMVCRQVFKNADPVALIECAEGCRTSHVHDKGVTF